MKNLNILLFLFLLMSTSLFSCNKDEDLEAKMDTEAPIVVISSPTTSATFVSGDTLHIEAMITENDELHDIGGSLIRTHSGTTEEVWTFEEHSHGTTYHLNEMYVIAVPGMHNDFVLKITASDHNGNETNEELHFHVMM